tara:strand:- start:7670 stop:7798 length:129 start_codon:yes stop_codon:yes gene_type:complete
MCQELRKILFVTEVYTDNYIKEIDILIIRHLDNNLCTIIEFK